MAPRMSCRVLSSICRGSGSGVRTACIDVTRMRGLVSEFSTRRLTIARRLASAGSVTRCSWLDDKFSMDSIAGKTSTVDDVKSVRSSAKISASTACGTTTIMSPGCSLALADAIAATARLLAAHQVPPIVPPCP